MTPRVKYHGMTFWYHLGNVDDLELVIPELQVKLKYTPRTVVVLAGCALGHQVSAWQKGQERACWVFFMQKGLFERFNIPLAGWCMEEDYREI